MADVEVFGTPDPILFDRSAADLHASDVGFDGYRDIPGPTLQAALESLASTSRELGYAELLAEQTITGTTVTDVTGLSITIVTPGVPYWVEASIEVKNEVTTDTNVSLFITDDANSILRTRSINLDNVTTERNGITIRRRFNDARGTTRTFKARVGTNQAGGDIDLVKASSADLLSYITAYRA